MTASVLSFPATDEPVLSEITPDLDSEVVDTATGEPFVVDTDRKASWAMRKLLEHRQAVAEVLAIAQSEIERIQQWAQTEATKHEPSISYFENVLIGYAHRERLRDPKRKSISTPYGKVSSRAGQVKYVIDPDVFLPWAEAEHPEWVKIEKSPRLAEVKAATTVEGTESMGEVAMTEHGEIVPGVTIEPAAVTYKVEVTP
jgi:hypothetical protein